MFIGIKIIRIANKLQATSAILTVLLSIVLLLSFSGCASAVSIQTKQSPTDSIQLLETAVAEINATEIAQISERLVAAVPQEELVSSKAESATPETASPQI